jgi:hypothetical protein
VVALGSLASHLPPGQKIKIIAEALAAAKAVSEEFDRAAVFERLAPHLAPSQITAALAAAKEIGNDAPRARALGALAPHLGRDQYIILIDTVAGLRRDRALNVISASMNISAALGGTKALEEIRRAISDTANWYP